VDAATTQQNFPTRHAHHPAPRREAARHPRISSGITMLLAM
jgi:hypothetical protein